jgi:hypothetical protein
MFYMNFRIRASAGINFRGATTILMPARLAN